MIIIPINQADFLRRLHRTRKIRIQGHIIIFTGRGIHPQIHITPDHRLQTQLAANIRYPFQMLRHDFRLGMVPVFQQIISQPQ